MYVEQKIMLAERKLSAVQRDWENLTDESRKRIVTDALFAIRDGQRELAEKVQSGVLTHNPKSGSIREFTK